MLNKPDNQETIQGIQVLKKLALLTVLVTGLLACIIWADPYAEVDIQRHINAAILDKQALLAQTKGKKIILVAGSNFLYGIDSDSLEKEIGLPVVNMSLPYYLGADFLLKQIEDHLQPGDVVVMGFEFMISRNGEMNEKMLTAQFYPPAKNWIEFPTWQSRISAPLTAYFLRIRKLISRSVSSTQVEPTVEDTTNELFRNGIDSHGDLISQDNNPSTGGKVIVPMNNDTDFLPVISCMDSVARIHPQVSFFYVFPTLSESGFATDKKFITPLTKQLTKEGYSFTLINSLADSIYPDSLFHNSPYHVTPTGRALHTKRLAGWIKRQL